MAAFIHLLRQFYTAHLTLDIAKSPPIALASSDRNLPQAKTPGTGMYYMVHTSPHRFHPERTEWLAVVVPITVPTHDHDTEQRVHLAFMVLVLRVEHRVHDPDTPFLSLTLHLEDDTIVHRAAVCLLDASLEDGLHFNLSATDPQIGVALPVSIKPWSLYVVLLIREHPGARELPETSTKQLSVHRLTAPVSLTPVPVSPSPHVAQGLTHALHCRRVDFHPVCVRVCVWMSVCACRGVDVRGWVRVSVRVCVCVRVWMFVGGRV